MVAPTGTGAPASTATAARVADPAEELRYGELHEHLGGALHAWLRLHLGSHARARIDPQDLVQEVWCRAWRSRERFHAAGVTHRAWVFGIARNVLRESLRESLPRLAVQQGLGSPPGTGCAGPEGDDAFCRAVRDEGFERLVAGLDPEERVLFALCGLEQLPYAEVARQLGLSRDAVAKRWQRMRRRLGAHGALHELLEPAS